uniref:Uncharacterized protein n=1 Tax=Plectus sambesii TaxID=2011161 RepID=A0A914UQI0_9BILA
MHDGRPGRKTSARDEQQRRSAGHLRYCSSRVNTTAQRRSVILPEAGARQASVRSSVRRPLARRPPDQRTRTSPDQPVCHPTAERVRGCSYKPV